MADPKKLSLVHLERGLRLMGRLYEEEGVATEMVAVYLATPGQLIKAKKEPAVLEVLFDQAAELDGTEAAQVIADFFTQCVAYSTTIQASLPKVDDAAIAKVLKAQPTTPPSNPTS